MATAYNQLGQFWSIVIGNKSCCQKHLKNYEKVITKNKLNKVRGGKEERDIERVTET